jgi:hypothetical protein
MDISIEGFHHFKVANWVGSPLHWEQSANEEEEHLLLSNGDSLDGTAHTVIDTIMADKKMSPLSV